MSRHLFNIKPRSPQTELAALQTSTAADIALLNSSTSTAIASVLAVATGAARFPYVLFLPAALPRAMVRRCFAALDAVGAPKASLDQRNLPFFSLLSLYKYLFLFLFLSSFLFLVLSLLFSLSHVYCGFHRSCNTK